MGSRIRSSPEKIFEVFVEVARPTGTTEEAFVLQKFPEDYEDAETLKSVPKFAFPCEADSNGNVELFSFVLTDLDSKFRFGICRHATGAQTCLCIISWLPWFEIFYRLLNYLAEIMNRTDSDSVIPLLKAFYKHPIPEVGELCDVIAPNFQDKFTFVTPDLKQLPTIPESRNLMEYYNAVDVNNMMTLFASMVLERRVLIVSKKLSKLTACVHASTSLLYPLYWQHIFIPLLPPHLIDYCTAPMPYVIGLHSSLLKKLRMSELGDAIILDADQNTVLTEHDDLARFPSDVVSSLRKRLRSDKGDKVSSAMVGDWLSRSFLKAMVALIGGYRDALQFRPGEPISFNPDAFVQSRGQNMKPLLEQIMTLQTFEQFRNDRLDMLNAGEGFQDEFEIENQMFGDRWGSQQRYRDWQNHMKKLRKGGKEKFAEFTGKANPAMRHAVRKVKDKTRKAYHGITSKIDELRESPEKSPSMSRNRPTTIPHKMPAAQRPPRPPPTQGSFHGTESKKVVAASDVVQQRYTVHTPELRKKRYSRDVTGWSRQYKILDLEAINTETAPRVSKRDLDDISQEAGPIQKPRQSSNDVTSSLGRPRRSVSDVTSSLNKPRLSKARQSTDDSEIELSFNRVSIDLMQDPDIQNVFKKSYSLEDLTVAEQDESSCSDSDSSASQEGYEALEEEAGNDMRTSQSAHNFQTHNHSDRESKQTHPIPPARPPRPTQPPPAVPSRPAPPVPGPPPLVPTPTVVQAEVEPKPLIDLAGIQLVDTTDDGTHLEKSAEKSIAPLKANVSSSSLGDNKETVRSSQSYVSLHTSSSSGSLENVKFNDTPNIYSQSCSRLTELNENFAAIAENSSAVDHPIPAKRTSLIRRNAFNKATSRPSSYLRTSPVPQAMDAQTISAARTAFMKTETIPKTSLNSRDSASSLDDFDPLSTGQLVCDEDTVDGTSGNSSTLNSSAKDEDLLKDWSLNFTSKKHPVPPPRPPKPQHAVSHMQMSSPGFIQRQAVAYPARPTMQPRLGVSTVQNPGTAFYGSPKHVQSIHSHQFVQPPRMTPIVPNKPNYSPAMYNTPGSVQVQTFGNQSSSYINRETSTSQPKTEPSQDPFSDLLLLSTTSQSSVRPSKTVTSSQEVNTASKSATLPPRMVPIGSSKSQSNIGLNIKPGAGSFWTSLNATRSNTPPRTDEHKNKVLGQTVANSKSAWEKFD